MSRGITTSAIPCCSRPGKNSAASPWYSFVYQHVLFLCLHTEDRPFGGLGAEQIAWVRRTLAEHTDVRWTMLFFHRPLWLEKDQAGYEQVEAALHGRPYTVFTGHLHHYVEAERDGMQHYALATTGGGSPLRGVEFGEFDHVTWVTMKPDGPVVVNLTLDGIVPDDIVTENIYPDIKALREGDWLHFDPVVTTTDLRNGSPCPCSLLNPTDGPLARAADSSPRSQECVSSRRKSTGHRGPARPTRSRWKSWRDRPRLHSRVERSRDHGLILTGGYEVRGKRLELPTRQHLDSTGGIRRTPANTRAASMPISANGRPRLHDGGTADVHPGGMGLVRTGGRTFSFRREQRDGKVYVAVETFDDHVITAPDPPRCRTNSSCNFGPPPARPRSKPSPAERRTGVRPCHADRLGRRVHVFAAAGRKRFPSQRRLAGS